MQNVVNYLCPFFLEDGRPNIAGRVHFVSPDCSAAPEEGTDPDYISIYAADGTTLLVNPMPLDSSGVFEQQPFVQDGIDYRMIVEAPTGIDDTPWRLLCIIDCKAKNVNINYSGVPSCGSLSELRQTDPAVGKCLVLGYTSADDCCPARVFKWEETLLNENYGTHVRSTLAGQTNAGTWVCEPSGFVDARWFGLVEGGTSDDPHDAATYLDRCHDAHPNIATYIPKGWYGLDAGLNFSTLIMEKDVHLVPTIGSNITLTIGTLENRGGFFCAVDPSDNSSNRVLPILARGELRSSWLYGSINEFLTASVLANVEEMIFDVVYKQGGASVELENIVVRIDDGVTVNNSITFSDCFIFRCTSGRLEATEFHISATGKTMNLDIDGLDIGNVTSSCEVDAAGIKSQTASSTYIMTLDYEKIEFRGSAVGGRGVLGGNGLEFYGSGYEAALYDVNGVSVTDGSDGANLAKDFLSIDLPGDKVVLTADKNGFKAVYEPAGANNYIRVGYNIIESSGVVPVQKGIRYPWIDKYMSQTDPYYGPQPDIDDTLITGGTRYILVVKYKGYEGFTSAITATPTDGKVIRVVYHSSVAYSNYDWGKAVLALTWNGNLLAALQFGGSVTLVADGNDWNVDYRRI